MSNYKERVKRAMLKHHEKDLREIKKLSNKWGRSGNKAPERDLVQKPCMEWMKDLGWDVQIYEAKATYDPRAGCYRQQSMKAGTVDCQGVSTDGYALFIEFKAPGKRATFNAPRNEKQREYLLNKINLYQFGVVIDSLELLKMFYFTWRDLVREFGQNSHAPKQYLIDALP